MCTATRAASRYLPSSLKAPSLARDFARRTLCRRHAAGNEASLVLVTSELVTNAVLHGAPPITASIDCGVTSVRVTVKDAARVHPHDAAAPRSASLSLVDKVADAWGTDSARDGKTVWCTLLADSFLIRLDTP